MRPHLPKSKPVKDRELLGEYVASHDFCAACGRSSVALHLHHIVGGRGGRSDEVCNLMRLCFHPCHDLAGGLDVPDPTNKFNVLILSGEQRQRLLPKMTFAIQLSLKARLGELDAAALARLAILHGRNLPDLEPIPDHFVRLWKMNRPELNLGGK